PASREDALRPLRARNRPEPELGSTARGRRRPRPDDRVRRRRRNRRRRRGRPRRPPPPPPPEPPRPDPPAPPARRARRGRPRARRGGGRARARRRRGGRRGRDLARLVELLVLRAPDRDPARAPSGALRSAGEDALTRLRPLGLGRAAAVFGAAVAFPFLVTPDWLVHLGLLTFMYPRLATAWNLFSGFTGYISLGQAAFFGIGAYTLAITFEHVSIGSGYRPFYFLPLIGLAVALTSLPVAWVALRTRAMTFAIVTLMFL